jgi:pyruvate, water dikinase
MPQKVILGGYRRGTLKYTNGKLAQTSGEIFSGRSANSFHQWRAPIQAGTPAGDGSLPPPPVRVPDSLVITAAAYRKFMSKNRLDEVVEGLLQGVDVQRIGELQRPAAQIKAIIHTSPIPEPVYSRIYTACQRLGRQATIVWPVTMPYELFRCSKEFQECPYLEASNPEELMGAIKTWWASLFDARAIYFRETNHQSHRDAEITIAAQQVPPPGSRRLLLPFATAFAMPGMS